MSIKAYDILKKALAQIAAESYLDGGVNPTIYAYGANHYDHFADLQARDVLGATQSTQLMWEDFTATWEVVSYQPNTSSGFSGTLLKNKITGEYTLAFRSTESKNEEDGGDVVRDSSQGANGQISDYGFAWGQILDMEKFYAELTDVNSSYYDAGFATYMAAGGEILNVSGYSLGAHLAQVFYQLHGSEIKEVSTFNGAGFGTVDGVPEGQHRTGQNRDGQNRDGGYIF